MNRILEMNNITKSFGNNPVLKGVNLNLNEGEVLALIGGNGAGKSTLMKILVGIERADTGHMSLYNKPFEPDLETILINDLSYLHQELNFLPNLSIWENMFLGREKYKDKYFLDVNRMKVEAQKVLSEYGVDISVETLVEDISVGEQQLIEIISSLMWDKKIITLDEPTSALTDQEVELLFEMIETQKNKGISFIYISHRMEEIEKIADRVIILRDGYTVKESKINEITLQEIIEAMAGENLEKQYPYIECTSDEIFLELKNLSCDPYFRDINLKIKKGEVFGITGLMGAGRTELMKSLYGILPYENGEVIFDKQKVKIGCPLDARELGIAFVTEDRKEEGLILDFDLEDNILISNLEIFSKGRWLDEKTLQNTTQKMINELNIKTESSKTIAGTLSGGNQQKVVIAKWLVEQPRLLILDEPTKGIDVKAKREIYSLMNGLKQKGVSIILVSSDLQEVIELSDRVGVMYEGNIQGILTRESANNTNIMQLATGGTFNV